MMHCKHTRPSPKVFGLVLLGTDSRAAKLSINIGHRSMCGIAKPWCHLFGTYPPVNTLTLDLPPSLPDPIKHLLINSRPSFAQLAAQFIKSNEKHDLDVIFKYVFTTASRRKKIFHNSFGRLGQIRLFQNAHYRYENFGDPSSTPLINSHFAILQLEANCVLLSDGTLENDPDCQWKPSSAFPELKNDLLLYLSFMGGKDFNAFQESGKPMPYSMFLMKQQEDIELRKCIVNFCNAKQKVNDGMFLESLMSASVCLASHFNGVGGVSLRLFLSNIIYQIQLKLVRTMTIGGFKVLDKFDDFKIPFLSPPNQPWPDGLLNGSFGNLWRTPNSDMIDLNTDCGISGESKDYGAKIDKSTMLDILRRIPKESKLHIVFTRGIQNKNLINGAFRREVKIGSPARKRAYFKVMEDDLTPINGLPSQIAKETVGIVVFFCISKDIKLGLNTQPVPTSHY